MWVYGAPEEVADVLIERQLWHIKRCGSHEDWRKDKTDDEIKEMLSSLKLGSAEETFKERQKWRQAAQSASQHAKRRRGKRKWKEEETEGDDAEGAAASGIVAATRLCETREMV